MPKYSPQTKYDIVPQIVPLRRFRLYPENYVVRPPYQRKSVWSKAMQQGLLDSLFRRYYIPNLVMREVRLGEDSTKREVVDGQQRIATVQAFFAGDVVLPDTLKDVNPALPGKRYSDLPADIREFVDDDLTYNIDLIKGIQDPKKPEDQEIAAAIFWRLQQGETLNYMEKAHARLSSLARNFVVKYADDQQFDYNAYAPVDDNPDKHRFFSVIARNNDRMQHLALLTRLLILEEQEGPADIRDANIMEYIDDYLRPDGIGNDSMETMPHAKRVLGVMNAFYNTFKDDPMVVDGGGMRELRIEYFILSVYLVLRHLTKYYVFSEPERKLFSAFVIEFHRRWRADRHDVDTDILTFSDNRQQTTSEIEIRDQIIRQAFFRFAEKRGQELRTKDENRAFSEYERIAIYRRFNGLCQQCLREGKPEQEARVAWRQYQADHVIPHSQGGPIALENAELLCAYHNLHKGATVAS
ncbi:MAG: DUF262 domain-containing protein [Anaerolineales bacterium]|nr:DUF262 domain-containing protein [Anaerolineales bacterium]